MPRFLMVREMSISWLLPWALGKLSHSHSGAMLLGCNVTDEGTVELGVEYLHKGHIASGQRITVNPGLLGSRCVFFVLDCVHCHPRLLRGLV